MRTSIDLTPYRRSTVGFDRLFDMLEGKTDGQEGYPPYNLVRLGEDSYRIELAVAGFTPDEVEVIAQQNRLTVSGKKGENEDGGEYLHRGIATRSFERRFELADYVEVDSANFENGLLSITLRKVVPEAMKPRRIEIGHGEPAPKQIDTAQAQNQKAA
ncbi:MAG: hypothetical protein CMH85_18130 [Novosphingobium sp.]|nr:hypothetical protein [Novosphingobium sp.]MAC60144.1 hypothetical protein [Novosphingobium sp.]|tara:strand:- start:3436 stop:3909 length:474 start_codon:yes stop_codon:yes gene_type:complete